MVVTAILLFYVVLGAVMMALAQLSHVAQRAARQPDAEGER